MTGKELYADYLEDIVDAGEQAIEFVGEMSYEQFVEDREKYPEIPWRGCGTS